MVSSFDELIKQACPEGVPRVPLGSVGTFTRGSGLQKADLQNEGFPAIHYGQVHTIYHHAIDRTCKFVGEDKADGFKKAQTGDIVLATTSEDDEAVGKAVAWLGDGEVAVSGDAVIYSHKLDAAYVSYFLESSDFQYEKLRYISGAKVRRISPKSLEKISIPHPPLGIQREIVRILDLFVDLDRVLEQEIIGREKQFESVRDTLLLSDKYERVPLGEIGSVAMCKRIFKRETDRDGDVPFYKIGTFGGNADSFIPQELFDRYRAKYPYPEVGELLISAAGTIGRIVEFDGEPSYFQDSNIVWLKHNESRLLNSYLKYCYQVIDWYTEGGTIKRLYNKNILNSEIPLPPLEVQEEIASKLDTFIEYIDNLKRERELRQKQYAHYRDLLLDLPVKE